MGTSLTGFIVAGVAVARLLGRVAKAVRFPAGSFSGWSVQALPDRRAGLDSSAPVRGEIAVNSVEECRPHTFFKWFKIPFWKKWTRRPSKMDPGGNRRRGPEVFQADSRRWTGPGPLAGPLIFSFCVASDGTGTQRHDVTGFTVGSGPCRSSLSQW